MRLTHKRSLIFLAVTLLALLAAACGGDDDAKATATADATAAQASEAAKQAYADTIRALAERADERSKELFDQSPIASTAEFVAMLAAALPEAIEGSISDIATLNALTVPDDYASDHARVVTFLEAQLALQRRELEAAEARDDLMLRDINLEGGTLARNLVSDLSEAFREFFLVDEEAIEAGELFGGLSDEESAYLDTVSSGFEEFGRRNAVFGQVLSRQFSDASAMLEALKGAGAGTAFDAVRDVIAPADPPPRFATDHTLLLAYLEDAVRLDHEIGQAIEEGDAVQFMVSNFEFAATESSAQALLGISAPVLDLAFPIAFAFREPGPDVLDGGYREGLHSVMRTLRARFPQGGPNYLAFNLVPNDVYQVVERVAPGLIAVLDETLTQVRVLTPPDELRDDHDRLVRYLEEMLAAQRALVEASSAEDFGGVRSQMAETRNLSCEAARGFSEAMEPVVFPQFSGPPQDPDLLGPCGPL